MPFYLDINPELRKLFEGDAANDVNTNPTEVEGAKIVAKTLTTEKILEVGNYTVDTNGLSSGSLLLESVTVDFDEYRYRVLEDAGEVIDIDDIYAGYEATGITERVGNIINTFKVNGVNSFELYGRTGLGYFAGGKLRWDYVNPADPNEGFEVLVDGSVIGGDGIYRYELDPVTGVTLGVAGSYISSLDAKTLHLEVSASIDANAPLVNLEGDDFHIKYGNVRLQWTPTDANNVLLRMLLSGVPKITFDGNSGIGTFSGGIDSENETEATSPIGAPNIFSGGVGIAKKIYTGDGLYFAIDAGVDPATPTGRFAIDGISYLYGNVKAQFVPTNANTASFILSLSNAPKVTLNAATGAGTFAGAVTVNDTTDSTSKDTGSIITEGGLGVEKSAYIGGLLNAPKVTLTNTATSEYAVLDTDTHIGVDNSASTFNVNLPAGTNGRKITIFDATGTASLGTITINRGSTNTINGATTYDLTTNYQSVTLLFSGTNWTVI